MFNSTTQYESVINRVDLGELWRASSIFISAVEVLDDMAKQSHKSLGTDNIASQPRKKHDKTVCTQLSLNISHELSVTGISEMKINDQVTTRKIHSIKHGYIFV